MLKAPMPSSWQRSMAAALEDPAVQRFVDGKEIRKPILVPNRLLNLVVG